MPACLVKGVEHFMSTSGFSASQHQASTLYLPPGPWVTVLDCLCEHFPAIGREHWLDRIARGRVLDINGSPIALDLAYKEGLCIYYFREVPNEKVIPVQETILYADEHLVVADKPHFLPVTPAGEYVEQTLLRRLIRRWIIHRWCRYTVSIGTPRGWSCSRPTRPVARLTSNCFPRARSINSTKPLRQRCRT